MLTTLGMTRSMAATVISRRTSTSAVAASPERIPKPKESVIAPRPFKLCLNHRRLIILISNRQHDFGFVKKLFLATLDFAKAPEQKQSQVTSLANNFYAQWRERHGLAACLRDASEKTPVLLLQSISQHQRLELAQLKTLDGQVIRVLHPGFGNVEGGPDFRNAVIQFGDAPPVSGDVEVDLRVGGWRAHGHDKNPAFGKVILHVVWEAERNAGPPILALHDVLDAPLTELSLQLDRVSVRTLPEKLRGQCAAPLRDLPEDALRELLYEAAYVRLQNKAAQFHARAQQAGWEQSLWEGLFRALGYKHNIWPMQYLAEQRGRWQRKGESLLALQARLWGVSGLLPAELNRKQFHDDYYLQHVWGLWWRDRDELLDCTLPRQVWRMHGLRPANLPQRRLALAAHWLHGGSIPEQLEHWCRAVIRDHALHSSLRKIFQVTQLDYWSWHWTFRSAQLDRPQPLLGEQRVTDLAVNAVLPWIWARAKAGGNGKLMDIIEHRFYRWPAAEDNSVLRLARQRLLGKRNRQAVTLRAAAAQQGLMQIVRDFCDHSNAACDGCSFPELVRDWRANTSPEEREKVKI